MVAKSLHILLKFFALGGQGVLQVLYRKTHVFGLFGLSSTGGGFSSFATDDHLLFLIIPLIHHRKHGIQNVSILEDYNPSTHYKISTNVNILEDYNPSNVHGIPIYQMSLQMQTLGMVQEFNAPLGSFCFFRELFHLVHRGVFVSS